MIKINDVLIGSGKPKICLPLTGKTQQEILRQADSIVSLPCNLVEWRADLCTDLNTADFIPATIHQLKKILGQKPLIFTIRTISEGGRANLSAQCYHDRILQALSAGAELVDVELHWGIDVLQSLIRSAHQNHHFVICSSHDFEKTPPMEDMKNRLKHMSDLGCDIAKLAVTPQTPKDVLALLSVSEEMSRSLPCPLISISMGSMGTVSRICGEIFGSSVTFGCGPEASAPGQISADKLSDILDIFHLNH